MSEWLLVAVVAVVAMMSVNSYSRGGSNNGSAHSLRVWHLIQFKCEGPVRWLRQWLCRAHSKCHLWWKSITPQESTVHLIDRDGEGHYAWYLLKRVRGREAVRAAVIAVRSDVWVRGHAVCACVNKLDQTVGERRKVDWGRQRKEERTHFCQSLSCILMSLLFRFISVSSHELYEANRCLKTWNQTLAWLSIWIYFVSGKKKIVMYSLRYVCYSWQIVFYGTQ